MNRNESDKEYDPCDQCKGSWTDNIADIFLVLAIFALLLLFSGEPDLMDALIQKYVMEG